MSKNSPVSRKSEKFMLTILNKGEFSAKDLVVDGYPQGKEQIKSL